MTTRRDLLKGLACGSLIVGFDPLIALADDAEAAGAAKLEHLPIWTACCARTRRR